MSLEYGRTVNVGLIGFGTVGKGIVKYFEEGRGNPFKVALKKVAVSDLSKPRDIQFPGLTDDARSIIKDPSIDIVVELVGGTGLARECIFEALDKGKSVVTANKAVVSKDMPELFNLARGRQVGFGFEASVGGGIPIIRTLLDYRGQKITRLEAILNGTTNFILTRMESGMDFNSALKIAQEKGFAEANHILDTGGFDTQAKLSIIASLILNTHVKPESISCRGITEVSPIDIDFAAKFGIEEGERGYVVKLLASARQHNGTWDLGVSPALVSKDHPLASIRDEVNAVTIVGDLAGPQTFIGKGAGTNPTTSAVITNVLQLADDLRHQTQGYLPSLDDHALFTKPEDITEIGYIRVSLLDIPRSMEELGRILGDYDLSVQHSLQRGRFIQSIEGRSFIPDIVTLHPARRSMIEKALEQLSNSDRVYDKPFFMQLAE